MTRALWPLSGLVLLSGCQVAPPERSSWSYTVEPQVPERFALSGIETSTALNPVHVLGESPSADDEGVDAPAASIELDDVLHSVEQHFPLVLAAREEIAVAEGELLAAQGGFDTQALGDGKSKTGFYDNDRVDLLFEQPTTLWGATFGAGYRWGGGDFAVYDGEEKSNKKGEFRVGMSVPLLQNRAIDKRRVNLWKARIERDRADPVVLEQRILSLLDAARVYWAWVAAGRQREVAVRLLALAEDRMDQITEAAEKGLLAGINIKDNQRLIVDRRAKLAAAERKLQNAGIKLSLFWRDAEGQPRVPGNDQLPYEFPPTRPAQEVLLDDDEAFALAHRPEIVNAELKLEQLRLEGELQANRLLPKLDFGVFASQDFGAASNTPDDKEDLEVEATLKFELPIQRREARGGVRRVEARTNQLEFKLDFTREKVRASVQDARSALLLSWVRIGEMRENARLAVELAEAERVRLGLGASDLFRVNLREVQAAAAAANLIDVLSEYFLAMAGYRASLGLPYELDDALEE